MHAMYQHGLQRPQHVHKLLGHRRHRQGGRGFEDLHQVRRLRPNLQDVRQRRRLAVMYEIV